MFIYLYGTQASEMSHKVPNACYTIKLGQEKKLAPSFFGGWSWRKITPCAGRWR